jgi:ADP-ribose pyrophosphatase YjhB (NUDIX family)
MSGVLYRRRGTAIIEKHKGILLTAGRHGAFILPGGGANRDESRFVAAIRELKEETGLLAYSSEIIFKHLGKIKPTHSGRHKFQDHHTVCVVKASGTPRPGGGDAKRLNYYYPGCKVHISTETKEIIERYYDWKNQKVCENSKVLDEDEGNEDIEDDTNNDYDDEEI